MATMSSGKFVIDGDENEPALDGFFDPSYRWNGWVMPYAWYSDIQAYCDAVGWKVDVDVDADVLTITFPDGTFDTFPKQIVRLFGGWPYRLYNLGGLVWRVVS